MNAPTISRDILSRMLREQIERPIAAGPADDIVLQKPIYTPQEMAVLVDCGGESYSCSEKVQIMCVLWRAGDVYRDLHGWSVCKCFLEDEFGRFWVVSNDLRTAPSL